MITNELKAFVESGVSIVVGTRDEHLVPEIVRAWGASVSDDRRTICLCVPEATSARTRNNLEENGRIAVSFSRPTDYQTVQIKGEYAGSADPSAGDLLAVERHRNSFASLNESIRIPRAITEAFWTRELAVSSRLVTIRFVAERIFDQTPGPGAGGAR